MEKIKELYILCHYFSQIFFLNAGSVKKKQTQCHLVFAPKLLLTSYQKEATPCFIQAVAGKRSSADDDESANHHSCYSNEHKDAPETSVS